MIYRKIVAWIVILSAIDHVKSEDLKEAESKDPSKRDIIKEIKRLNQDGSYTFGYEAEDGTFKIESRDVLGNVKGTFGYIDADGEIRRVSYTTSNTTDQPNSDEKEVSSVIQQIPKLNRTTTRRPSLIYQHVTSTPSPSSVIQSIPRRRIIANATTEKTPKAIKFIDFDSKTSTDSSQRSRPSYVRSTISSNADGQKYTEGQIIRPTQTDMVTPRPTDPYLRLLVTKSPFISDSSTIKPITEEFAAEPAKSNLLRRQLSQERVSNFDARAHVLDLQQSLGDDASDVYSSSFTTGSPRPLFTTTGKSKFVSVASTTAATTISKNGYRHNTVSPQETTTDATTENSYVTPNPIPILQYQDKPRHPYRGAFFIPVNRPQQDRYVYDDVNEQGEQYPRYMVINDPYQRAVRYQPNVPRQLPLVYRSKHLINPIHDQDYQRPNIQYIRRPVIQFQDDIDNIQPPVSTRDFQKLLNRLISRQNYLKEINRVEQSRYQQDPYYQERPVVPALFVRTSPDPRDNQGPMQFLPQQDYNRQYQPNQRQVQYPDQYNAEYTSTPVYRAGRKVTRMLNYDRDNNELADYLPPDLREMLLLRMLQLAINPNLPLPPAEEETTAAPSHRKEAVRNVEILGEESEGSKPAQRNKRYDEDY